MESADREKHYRRNNAPAAYGIDWMGFRELKEAIPPAYTRYLAEAMMGHNAKVSGAGTASAGLPGYTAGDNTE